MGVNPNQGMFLAAVLSNIGKGHAVYPAPPTLHKKRRVKVVNQNGVVFLSSCLQKFVKAGWGPPPPP